MPRSPLILPDSAQMTTPAGDGRLHAPSAERNIEPILGVLAGLAPKAGRAVELASGTGQHIARFAAAHAGIQWQPTDIAPDRLPSIEAWRAAAGLANLRPPMLLDGAQDWPDALAGVDLIVTVNLFHLVSSDVAERIIANAAAALGQGGLLFIYGPFRTGGAFRSESDLAFHTSLVGQDATIGYKDAEWMTKRMQAAGLSPRPAIEMPANNLCLTAVRGSE
jgi:cyclopropane fatty-acyl-phospholipid synthase-like methyltransferase